MVVGPRDLRRVSAEFSRNVKRLPVDVRAATALRRAAAPAIENPAVTAVTFVLDEGQHPRARRFRPKIAACDGVGKVADQVWTSLPGGRLSPSHPRHEQQPRSPRRAARLGGLCNGNNAGLLALGGRALDEGLRGGWRRRGRTLTGRSRDIGSKRTVRGSLKEVSPDDQGRNPRNGGSSC